MTTEQTVGRTRDEVPPFQWTALSMRVIAVAVRGEVKDWAAYIDAVPGDSHDREWKRVSENGTKLPESVARALFPMWTHLRWRP